MKRFEKESVWFLWNKGENTARIAQKLQVAEYQVERVLHQYLDRVYEARQKLQRLA